MHLFLLKNKKYESSTNSKCYFKINYAGKTFLIDPFFAPAGIVPSLVGKETKNPLVGLPVEIPAILEGVEAVFVSHMHIDHFDPVAQQTISKNMPLYCQPADLEAIKALGFTKVQAIDQEIKLGNITITRTEGQHGVTEQMIAMMGKVSGFVFQAEGEPTVYWTGDTVWYEEIQNNITRYNPDLIVCHSGGNRFTPETDIFPGVRFEQDTESIIMDKAQTIEVCKFAPQSKVLANHMGAIDHGIVTRADLRAFATEQQISVEQLFIPADGETLEF